jgi:tellurite methyltransferase
MRRIFLDKPDWDTRYKEGVYTEKSDPHWLVRAFWGYLPPGGRVVDIAMGTGRDLLFLADQGFEVYGIDRSWEGLKLARAAFEKNDRSLGAVQADALSLPLKRGSFDGVLVFYFLERQIMRELTSLLKPGGLLFYETFLKRQNEIDRQRNPAFLLENNELPTYFNNLEPLYHQEGIFTEGNKTRAAARYIGRKP